MKIYLSIATLLIIATPALATKYGDDSLWMMCASNNPNEQRECYIFQCKRLMGRMEDGECMHD